MGASLIAGDTTKLISGNWPGSERKFATSLNGRLSNFNSAICRSHVSEFFGASAAGLGLAGLGWAKAFEAGQISSAAQAARARSLVVGFMIWWRFKVDDVYRSQPEHARRSRITQET